MRILFTGASSFTGYWFVKMLTQAGHEVTCPVTGELNRYEGVRRRRVSELGRGCTFVPHAAFGTDNFIETIRHGGGWDLLCHHAAEMANYRSPDFDPHRATLSNCSNLRTVLSALQEGGLKAVVLTGTVFENDEGLGSDPVRAFSPYGLSKGMTYQTFRYYCGHAAIRLAKFVIPNPFGPLEEERFTAYLMKTWHDAKNAAVKTPSYVRDNIPVDLLARAYALFAERASNSAGAPIKLNPSGYIESQGAFARRVASEVSSRLGWDCRLDLPQQQDFSEPLVRINSDPVFTQFSDWSESAFWDSFAQYYQETLR